MIVVFGTFAFSRVLAVQLLGFGLAVAVLLDATLIRMVLVPAFMHIAGSWNWWPGGRRIRKPTESGSGPRAAAPIPTPLPTPPPVAPTPPQAPKPAQAPAPAPAADARPADPSATRDDAPTSQGA